MKKISFKVEGLPLKFSLRIPEISFKRDGKTRSLLKIVSAIGYSSLILILAILPLSAWFFLQYSYETSIFVTLFGLTIVALLSYLILIIFFGKKVLVDPVGFMPILFFALFLITSAVFATIPDASNTFGRSDYIGNSGLFVMLMLGFFYILNFFFASKVDQKNAKRAFKAGLIFYTLTTIISLLLTRNEVLTGSTTIALFFGVIVTLSVAYKSTKFFPAILISLIGLLILVLRYDSYLWTESLRVTFTILSVATALYIYTLIRFFDKFKKFIKDLYSDLKQIFISLKQDKKIDVEYFINKFTRLIFFTLPVFAWIYTVVVATKLQFDLSFFTLGIERIFNTLKTITLAGSGIASYQSGSMLINIINTQGILGLVAYTILIIYALRLGFIELKKMYKAKLDIFFLAISTIIISVPILGIFTYPGLVNILLWWFAFIFLVFGNQQSSKNFSVTTAEIKNLIIRGKELKFSNILRAVISIVAVGIIVVISIAFLGIILSR